MESDAEKAQARRILNQALRRGFINKASHCRICSRRVRLEAHHPDYSKPLDVIWVCRRCHALLGQVPNWRTILRTGQESPAGIEKERVVWLICRACGQSGVRVTQRKARAFYAGQVIKVACRECGDSRYIQRRKDGGIRRTVPLERRVSA